MSKEKKSLIFFGNERLATGVTTTTPILNGLISAGYIPKLIVVNYTTFVSRRYRKLEILDTASRYGIPVLNTNNNVEILEHIYETKAPFAVLAAYGRIVPQTVLDSFPDGIINIHPSLLPKHRGPTPIESVLLNGESATGVSIMKLVKAMDAGPVYLQQKVEVDSNESKQQLCDKLAVMGADLLINNLEDIISGNLKPNNQNNTLATYDKLIKKEDGTIEWTKPAELIEREIRAYQLWPQSRTVLGNIECVVTKSHIFNKSGPASELFISDNKLGVYCGEKSLIIDELKPVGKPAMDSISFLAGYKNRITIN